MFRLFGQQIRLFCPQMRLIYQQIPTHVLECSAERKHVILRDEQRRDRGGVSAGRGEVQFVFLKIAF